MGIYYCLRNLAGAFRTIRRGIYRINHVIQKEIMFRRLEDNDCIISAINLEKIKDFINVKIDEIVFAGRAIKGALLCQIKVPKVTEPATLVAAVAASVGAGIYYSIVKASEDLVVWDQEYLPNSENYSKYAEIKEQWQEVYENQLSLVDKGLTQSMWKTSRV